MFLIGDILLFFNELGKNKTLLANL